MKINFAVHTVTGTVRFLADADANERIAGDAATRQRLRLPGNAAGEKIARRSE